MSQKRITLTLSVQQTAQLRALVKKHRQAESDFVNDLVSQRAEALADTEGSPERERALRRLRQQARIEEAQLRRERWPALDVLMGEALDARLGMPDLAGPWEPLTRSEQARLSLSGRWPACLSGCERGTEQRAFTLDAALVLRLRTAAWRISEPVLTELERRGLTGVQSALDEEARIERERLAARLYPSSRIAREAVADHWPLPRTR